MGDVTQASADVPRAIVQGALVQLVSLPTIEQIEAELSRDDLFFRRSFAEACPDAEKVKQVVSQLPWSHVIDLSAVDDLLRRPGDKPTIGLLLCRSKDRIVVEYALRDLKKPIRVAGWETKIVEKLPENLKGSLPTVEELEAELSREENER